MAYQGVFESFLRLGVITSVDYLKQSCTVRYLDRLEDREYRVPLVHPGSSTDTGVFMHPSASTLVLLGVGQREQPYIVGYIPNSAFVRDLADGSSVSDIPVDFSGYPYLRAGEVALAGPANAEFKMDEHGNILAKFGSSNLRLQEDNKVVLKCRESTEINDAGYKLEGIVQRDLRKVASSYEEIEEKLTSTEFSRVMSQIGRDPNLSPVTLSNGIGTKNQSLRNPALVENKEIVYEFSRRDAVSHLDNEISYQKDDKDVSFTQNQNDRVQNRFDVLSQNVNNPNLLIEKVAGTLVDIYGNLLDINRNKIEFPRTPDPSNTEARLGYLNALLNRTIKFHFEINSKKDSRGKVATNILDGKEIKNGHTHSRWSLDVDGEGLTKINIPASSNIGNIPVLSRYVNSHLQAGQTSNSFKSKDYKDISHLAFGDLDGNGVPLPKEYAPTSLNKGQIMYRTAFHDLTMTANSIISTSAINKTLDNRIPVSGVAGAGNAGGRSLHANLDGSLELNIGRDVADGKSIVLDTSGGIYSRIGRTAVASHEASLVSHLDGSVYIQIGGKDAHIEGLDAMADPEVKLFVTGSKGTDEIHITKDFVKLKSARGGKSILIDSSKNLILKASGTVLISGGAIGTGSYDEEHDIPNIKRQIQTSGKEI